MLPGFGDPVDDFDEVVAAHALINLSFNQFSFQESAQEALHRLSVVGTQHPPEGLMVGYYTENMTGKICVLYVCK